MRALPLALALLAASAAEAAPPPCHAAPMILGNGTVLFDGGTYAGADALKTALMVYRRKTPACAMQVVAQGGVDPRFTSQLMALLRQTGFTVSGVQNEPR